MLTGVNGETQFNAPSSGRYAATFSPLGRRASARIDRLSPAGRGWPSEAEAG